MRIKFGHATLLLALGLSGGFVTAADPPPRFPNEQITLSDWQTYLDEVRSIPDVRCQNTPRRELSCLSDKLRAIWVFTSPGHPAHPAISTGVLVVYSQSAGILFRGYYAGDELAFNAWAPDAYRNLTVQDKWTHDALTHNP
jgi:hypothetical protein